MNEITLNDLVVGETCWTHPWGCFYFDGELWLNSRYPALQNKSETASLLVMRDEDGYLIDFSHTDYQPREMVDTWIRIPRILVADVCYIKPNSKLKKIVYNAIRGSV